MFSKCIKNVICFEFFLGVLVYINFFGVVFFDECLWVVGDEVCVIDCLFCFDLLGFEFLCFGEGLSFLLLELLDLFGVLDEEVDLEGMVVVDGYLWVVGLYGFKCKNVKSDWENVENVKWLVKVMFDGNCCLLVCLFIEMGDDGKFCFVWEVKDGCWV